MAQGKIFAPSDPSIPELDPNSEYSKTALSIVNELEKCPLGPEGWREFEKICKKIILFVFEPCFHPFGEISEQEYSWNHADRLDYRMPNNTRSDRISTFWQEIKQDYDSHNIVIECKNLNNPLEKEEILQTAGYSWHTNGKFRIIFSRKGVDEKGLLILRQQFQTEGKLIIVFSENDLNELIKSRIIQIEPEVILCHLRSKIFDTI